MSSPNSQGYRVLITGATSAIGGALAEIYASQGVKLYLTGRNKEKLFEVAEKCRNHGAEVSPVVLDMRDFTDLRQWLDSLDSMDLVIVNAGRNTHIGPGGESEPWDEVEALVDVNFKAAMVVARAAIPGMKKKGEGQIAFMSSLAANFGLPMTPAYCASKAAVKAYGEALRGQLASQGIKVNVVMPGYVKSAMCDEMPGPKPFLMKPAKAAHVIQKGLAMNKARISFPFPLNLGTWFLGVLPARFSIWIIRRLGYDS